MVEASIDDMQTAMRRGRVTSKELVLQSFARIAFYKDLLNPTISLFRDAVAQAEELDLERAQGRGLHRAGVQRAGVDRDGLRVRAGDEEAHSAAEHAVGRWSHA